MNTIKKYFSLLFILAGMLLVANSDAIAQSRGGGHSGGSRSGGSVSSRSASYRGTAGSSYSRAASYSSRPAVVSSRPASLSSRPYAAGRAGYAARPYGRGGVYGGYGHGYGYGGRFGYNGFWGYGWRGLYPFFPYFGFYTGILPFGYLSFYYGGYPYYYYDGIYYQPYGDNQYQVVEPPLGATVSQLPSEAVPTVVDGHIYYLFHGTYYQQNISSDNQLSYTVVGVNGVLNTGNNNVAPDNGGQSAQQDNVPALPQHKMGDKLSALPEGSKTVVVNQQKLFEDPSGTYYQESIEGNQVVYKVVGQASAQ